MDSIKSKYLGRNNKVLLFSQGEKTTLTSRRGWERNNTFQTQLRHPLTATRYVKFILQRIIPVIYSKL